MNRSEAEERMTEVQRIMERTTLYTLLPGPPAIAGGLLALVGCVVSIILLGSLDAQKLVELSRGSQAAFWVMWTVIGVAAVGYEVLWTRSASKKAGMSPMTRPARFAALSLSPSVVAAAVLTVKLMLAGEMRYVAPVWMMCYGTGLYAAGLFSVKLPRLLGVAFLVMGAVGLLWLWEYGVALVGLSFGVLHVVFGILVLRLAGRGEAT